VKEAPRLPVPPAFRVKRTSEPITLDGCIAPGEWPGDPLTLQQRPSRTRVAGAPCTARLCRHGNMLHVAVTVPVKNVGRLKRGSTWGQDDGIEVCFVDAKGALPTHSFSLHGFCGGASESVTDGGAALAPATRLGKAVRFAAAVSDASWTGEWAIALDAADITPQPGTQLAFNLCVHRSESREWIVWVGTFGPAWRLENAGTIVLE